MDKTKENDNEESISEIMASIAKEYEERANAFWDGLSYDEKLLAFYSVVKRIAKGELEDRRSYRGVLYTTFGFGMDSYAIGLECNYLELHNAIYTPEEINSLTESLKPDDT